jgi:hypothetical protein
VNLLVLIAALTIAGVSAVFLKSVPKRRRTHWSARRQQWTAVLAIPVGILAATGVGIAWVVISGRPHGENTKELAVAGTAVVGGCFVIIALVGGILGVRLANGRKDS